MRGKFLYCDTVLGVDGRTVFGVPMASNVQVLTIDAERRAVERVGELMGGIPLLHFGGAALGHDGHLYASPFGATQVRRFDTFSPMLRGTTSDDFEVAPLYLPSAQRIFGRFLASSALDRYLKKGLSATDAAMITAVAHHWREWAARRTRCRRGRCARDGAIGYNDAPLAALLGQQPDVLAHGLVAGTASPLAADLFDLLRSFRARGLLLPPLSSLPTESLVDQVAAVPGLAEALVEAGQEWLFREVPIFSSAVARPGQIDAWLICSLGATSTLAQGAVQYLEHISSLSCGGERSSRRNTTRLFEKLSRLDNLLFTALRLPSQLQERLLKTRAVVSVLDELLTERPLALVVVAIDGVAIGFLLVMLLRASFLLFPRRDIWLEEALGDRVIAFKAIFATNTYFFIREISNTVAMCRLGLIIHTRDIFDLCTACVVYVLLYFAKDEVLKHSYSAILPFFSQRGYFAHPAGSARWGGIRCPLSGCKWSNLDQTS